MTHRTLVALVFALGTALPGALAAQNVAEVQVAPPSVTVKVGERSGLIATAFDRNGNVIPTVRILWTSNNVAVAKVDNNGTVTGVASGVVIISARSGTRSGTAAVQVVGGPPPAQVDRPTQTPPVNTTTQTTGPSSSDPFWGQPAGSGTAAALRIDPPSIFLIPSENARVSPRALREDGAAAAPVRVDWKSLREDIATVNSDGIVVALAPGQGTIQATGPGGLTATAPVVVQQAEFAIRETSPLKMSPGDVDTLHVAVPSQSGRAVNPLALQWSSSDANVARVSLTGAVTAAGPGRATLTVNGLLQAKTIDLQVHKVVEVLVVRPKSSVDVNLPLTATQKFEAQALAANSEAVPEAPLRWSVADSTIAAFDDRTGILTGKRLGRTQLTVRGPGLGLQVSWNVNVVAGNVRLSAPRLGLKPGARYTYRADFTDSAGTVLAPANVTWASDNADIVAVSEDGTVEAAGYGHAKITATAPGGKTAVSDVFVQGEILVASSRKGKFQLYAVDRSNLADLRKISADTVLEGAPAFSPDGSRIAYVSTKDGNPEIYVMDTDGRGVTRVTADPQADDQPSFTPDGRQIVFQSARAAGKPQIFIMNADGTSVQQLTHDSVPCLSPTVSPDGQTIAYVTTRDKSYHIWLMGRDGSNQRAFTRGTQKETQPQFMKDGGLAYLVERKDPATNHIVEQVMRADLATGSQAPLTGTDLAITDFAVSSAGDLLALEVNAQPENRKNPLYKVYVVKPGIGTAIPLPTTGTEQMRTPAFLP
jgi:TolB protein